MFNEAAGVALTHQVREHPTELLIRPQHRAEACRGEHRAMRCELVRTGVGACSAMGRGRGACA